MNTCFFLHVKIQRKARISKLSVWFRRITLWFRKSAVLFRGITLLIKEFVSTKIIIWQWKRKFVWWRMTFNLHTLMKVWMSRTYKKVAIVPTQTGSFSVRHNDNLSYFILLESKLYRKRKLYVDSLSSLLARLPFRHQLNKTQSFSIQKRIYSSYYNRIFNITFIRYNESN